MTLPYHMVSRHRLAPPEARTVAISPGILEPLGQIDPGPATACPDRV